MMAFTVLLGWAIVPSAFGQTAVGPHRGPVAPVPPTLEVELLDPNADPLGNPAVETEPIPGDPNGEMRVAIPPAVLVHRYYYTGDRSFQGPMLPGGPMILVANHPGTGERVYVEAVMLPGAPRIIYTRHAIEYNFGPQSIRLIFGHHGKAWVQSTQGYSASDRVQTVAIRTRERVGNFVRRTGVPDQVRAASDGTHEAAGQVADGVNDARRAVSGPVVGVLRSTPVVRRLFQPADRRAARARESELDRATQALENADLTIPTVR